MDYQKIYNSLIERGRSRTLVGYTERHHILPRCMTGPDTPENIVRLTPEEHYLAHQLLIKLHPDNTALARSAGMMCMGRPTNKLYGWVRRRMAKAFSKNRKGQKLGPMSETAKLNLSKSMKGKNIAPKSLEHRQKIGLAQLGKKRGPYGPRK